jgi:hypothetical protein
MKIIIIIRYNLFIFDILNTKDYPCTRVRAGIRIPYQRHHGWYVEEILICQRCGDVCACTVLGVLAFAFSSGWIVSNAEAAVRAQPQINQRLSISCKPPKRRVLHQV